MVVQKSREEAFSECQAMGQVFLTCPCTYFTPLVTFRTVNYYAHFTDEKTEALSDWPQSVLPSVSHRTEYWTQTHILPVASFCFWKYEPPACHGFCGFPLSLRTELGFMGFVLRSSMT